MILNYTTDSEVPAAYLARQIRGQLAMGSRVLWLVPGGSGVAVAAIAARILTESGTSLAGLTVTLTDERYGPVGHSDSNFAALELSGFTLAGATLIPVLIGAPRTETTTAFSEVLEKVFAISQYCIGLFGIGSDGHTAGMLPRSTATKSKSLVSAYSAGIFERITITPRAINLLNEAVVYALGKEKWNTIATLLATNTAVVDQPAQALKQVPHTMFFSDYPQ